MNKEPKKDVFNNQFITILTIKFELQDLVFENNFFVNLYLSEYYQTGENKKRTNPLFSDLSLEVTPERLELSTH